MYIPILLRGALDRGRIIALLHSFLWETQRYEDLRVLALNQQRHVLARGMRCIFQLLHRVHALAVDPEDDVARLYLRRLRRSRDLLHQQAPLSVRLLLLARLERPHRETERARLAGGRLLGLAAAIGDALLLLLELGDLDVERLLLAVAPQREIGVRARTHPGDRARELAEALDLTAVDGEDDVPGSDAGARRRAVLPHRGHQCTTGPVEAEGFGELGIDVLDGDADTTAYHAAGLDELLLDVTCHIDRDGEGDAHEAAGTAEDLRVDADHFARQVKERAAGVAGIDRHVGLDEGYVVLAGHRARCGADDARGGAVLEAERRADGEHPLSGLQARGIAELHDRQIRAIDLDHRDIGALVGTDHLGGKLAPVGEAHGHLVGIGNHVGVGQDVAVGVDDEAGARTSHRRLPPLWALIGCRNAETPEEIIERIIR